MNDELEQDYPLALKDPNRIRRHLSEMVTLALPVIFSRTGILLLAVVDFATLGQSSSLELASFTLGQSPFNILLTISIGLMLGTMISTSHAYGENQLEETGAIWRRSLPFGMIVGVIFASMCLLGESYFELVQQPPELIEVSAEVTAILGLSLIPTIFFLTSTYFLEAIKRPRAVVVLIIIANVLNYIGNILVVDEYGAVGVAWVTTGARVILGGGLSAYIWYMRDHQSYGIRKKVVGGWWHTGSIQRRHGYAAGISLAFETIAFGIMSIYAGWLGADALAMFGVNMNIMALCFMVAVGVANATGVRVGIAHGRKDYRDRSLAGWMGLGLITFVLVPIGALLLFMPDFVLSFYLNEDHLIAASISILFLITFINFGDGGQVVLQSALRGSDDKWPPTIISFCAYFLIMLPMGYVFTQTYQNGVIGLFQAIASGTIFTIFCLLIRWFYLSRRGEAG